jgi:hypothetical protein
MILAFSRLKYLLAESDLNVSDLHRRLAKRGARIRLKILYDLCQESRALDRLDLRVAGAVCQFFKVSLNELITFENGRGNLRRFSAAKQKRLNALMTRNNDGDLDRSELKELKRLVSEAEAINLRNTCILAEQKQQFMPK